MKKSIYSIPRLCKAKNGWYVHFRYQGIQKRYKFKLNYIHDLAEREREFNMLRRALHQKLKDGWNPLVPDSESELQEMYLTDAINFGLEKKLAIVSKTTYANYKSAVKFYIEAIEKLQYDFLTINDTKRVHIRKITDKARQLNKWSNKSYNKNLNYISAVLSELVDWEIIEHNPAHKIKMLPVTESTANRCATDKEHEAIKQKLETEHPYYYNFIKTEYHTGIRPKEILSIQLYMIDLENREINLPPIITKSGTIARDVTINNFMYDLLCQMEIEAYPEDFYLFGSYRQRGKGNRGKYIDFIPGPTPLKRDTATKRWKKIIKDGLGINVNMYSYKHKGGDDKLIAGVDFDSIRDQYGHATKKMSRTYVKKIKGVYKKDIIDNSPDF